MKITTWWDAHTDKVAHRSNRWAITDRGWLIREGQQTSLGHYLDYGPCDERFRTRPDGSVHAVVCSEGAGCRASMWHKTVEDAMRWIESETSAGECPINPKSKIYR